MGITNKSFLYGICCASVTWAVSIYLYWQLTTKGVKTAALLTNNFTNTDPVKTNLSSYRNSEKLIKHLQPVIRKHDKQGKNIYIAT